MNHVPLCHPLQVDLAVHLGDIIDGFQPKDKSADVLDSLLRIFDGLGSPHYHVIGNHCLYNIPRPILNAKLKMGSTDGPSYCSLEPHASWRLLMIDSYDISLLGWEEGHPNRDLAVTILDSNNPNKNKNSNEGMEGVQRRFVGWGGGVSTTQLEWIRQEIKGAAEKNQKVIVCTHLGITQGSCPPACLLYNFDEVSEALASIPGVVVATFSGHSHQNGYARSEVGSFHSFVLSAVVETPPGRDSFGIVHLYDDEIEILGTDTMMSMRIKF